MGDTGGTHGGWGRRRMEMDKVLQLPEAPQGAALCPGSLRVQSWSRASSRELMAPGRAALWKCQGEGCDGSRAFRRRSSPFVLCFWGVPSEARDEDTGDLT